MNDTRLQIENNEKIYLEENQDIMTLKEWMAYRRPEKAPKDISSELLCYYRHVYRFKIINNKVYKEFRKKTGESFF